jgi:hypothetical protein
MKAQYSIIEEEGQFFVYDPEQMQPLTDTVML